MRKHYLDNIRWITVVIVVIYHVFYMYNSEGILGGVGQITGLNVQHYDIFMYLVYPWFMPILYIVAGISSRLYLENHTDKEFIKSRSVKLLVPSTIGLFVFWFIQGYINMSFADAFDTMTGVPKIVQYFIMAMSGIGVLWYIQLLWVFSLCLLLVRKIDKDRLWNLGRKIGIIAILLMVLLAYGGAQILNTPIICVYRFGYYGVAFFLGYFVFSHDEVIEVLKKYFFLLLAAALILGFAFCYKYFGENYADAPINRYPLFTSFGWFASMAILGGGAKYLNYTNAFMTWMTKRNFGLYVFHYLGISSVALFIAKPGLIPAPAAYALSLAAGFVFGYGLYAVISRIPYYRWAVLGIKEVPDGKEGPEADEGSGGNGGFDRKKEKKDVQG